MNYSLEICAGSLESALAAQKGGANRVELCDNLSAGGTTPSHGMIKTCCSLLNIPVFPIIRPRGGNFTYSDEEFEVMKHDVWSCLELGCEGIVFGILRPDVSIDMEKCSELIGLAGNMQLTFHRAFDQCKDREKGLEELIALGFDRVLSSGGKEYAHEAIGELKRLIIQSNDRICIMPGSGINEQNLLQIAMETGAVEFHTTAKRTIDSRINAHHHSNFDQRYLFETDEFKVAEMRNILDSCETGR